MIRDLNSQFSLKDLGDLNLFLGIEAHRTEHGLHLCQAKNATELLVKTHMLDVKVYQTPIVTGVKLCIREVLSEHYNI